MRYALDQNRVGGRPDSYYIAAGAVVIGSVNETTLGVIKVLSFVSARSVTLSLFRRRQPLSRRKEVYLAAIRGMLAD